jgi:hypothetical protein
MSYALDKNITHNDVVYKNEVKALAYRLWV